MIKNVPLNRAFTLIEPGPVVLVATHGQHGDNVMTVSWTMALDFAPRFALATGPWNFSFAALRETGECVIATPTIDLLDVVVGVGTCSGAQIDKFARFCLTRAKARHVAAPLIVDCLANIECRVVEWIERHNIIVLEGLAAYVDDERAEKRLIHAVGDGHFIADGARFDRADKMRDKLPDVF